MGRRVAGIPNGPLAKGRRIQGAAGLSIPTRYESGGTPVTAQ